MRKNFPLAVTGLHPARVIDSIKNEVRKYLKRERRKTLPEGADFWDFDCQVGPDRATPNTIHVAELIDAIDAASREQQTAIYIEIIAKPGYRTRRDPESAPDGQGEPEK